ncbi:MAG: UDP-N-acetylmuramate--L-alanine ligase, partial [Oscillospiraceae bacterium]
MNSNIDNEALENFKHIHFIGIGGSGMYPLVQILHKENHIISGSDNNPGDTIDTERKMGITVYMGHKAENIEGADLVVYSAAIMKDNAELVAAREKGIPTMERSILLGLVTQRYDNCICVCGTHGKTTTTSMITQTLLGCDLDPSAVIGGKLSSIGGSGRVGSSDILVCEACEYVDTFLRLSPDIVVILNVDADHLEYFKTIENIIKSFNKFASMATKTIVVNGDDENSLKSINTISGKKIVTYGLKETNDYFAKNIIHKGAKCGFDLYHKGKYIDHVQLSVNGQHNVLNALACYCACLEVNAKQDDIIKSIDDFKGAHRRFDILGTKNGITFADDYAHHPAEIKVTLETAKEMGYKDVWCVHQPFTFSRTKILLDDFANALKVADKVVLSAIMGGRETNTYNIHTKDLADKIDGCVWFETFE